MTMTPNYRVLRKQPVTEPRKTATTIRVVRVQRQPTRLRYPRKEVMELLGISMSTVIRREQDGRLKPIRDVPGGVVFYSHADVMKLASA